MAVTQSFFFHIEVGTYRSNIIGNWGKWQLQTSCGPHLEYRHWIFISHLFRLSGVLGLDLSHCINKVFWIVFSVDPFWNYSTHLPSQIQELLEKFGSAFKNIFQKHSYFLWSSARSPSTCLCQISRSTGQSNIRETNVHGGKEISLLLHC